MYIVYLVGYFQHLPQFPNIRLKQNAKFYMKKLQAITESFRLRVIFFKTKRNHSSSIVKKSSLANNKIIEFMQ